MRHEFYSEERYETEKEKERQKKYREAEERIADGITDNIKKDIKTAFGLLSVGNVKSGELYGEKGYFFECVVDEDLERSYFISPDPTKRVIYIYMLSVYTGDYAFHYSWHY